MGIGRLRHVMEILREMVKDAPSRLAQIRKEKGYSQQNLAELIGAHSVTISKLERGKISMTYEWAFKIAQVLKVNPFDIFDIRFDQQSFDIQGYVIQQGKVVEPGPHLFARISSLYINDPQAQWFNVQTTDFFPIFRENDWMRVLSVEPHQFEACQGRLCLAQSDTDRNDLRIGILGVDQRSGSHLLLRLNGSVIDDFSYFTVLGCVVSALFAPKEFGSAQARATAQNVDES